MMLNKMIVPRQAVTFYDNPLYTEHSNRSDKAWDDLMPGKQSFKYPLCRTFTKNSLQLDEDGLLL